MERDKKKTNEIQNNTKHIKEDNSGVCKNMVFSSVGDNSYFYRDWVSQNMNYDIYLIYYGNHNNIYNSYKNNKNIKFIIKKKGSKFQNLYFFFHHFVDIIKQYTHFFILDDDIIIDSDNINKMFVYSNTYKLDICGPSFSNKGIISHGVNLNKKNVKLSYTNFIEVNTPLFSKNAIEKLMIYLDKSLIGWGIDYLYIWSNGINKKKSYAIIHDVVCINPLPIDKKQKTNVRELTNISNWNIRRKIWTDYAKTIGCPAQFRIINYADIV